MLRAFARYFNPRHEDGADWGHIILSALLVFAVGFAAGVPAGWQAHTVHDSKWFQQHYNVAAEHLYIAPVGKPLPMKPRGAFLPTGSISIAHYPAVGDQGPEGSCAAWADAWAISFQYRMLHLHSHPAVRFSPKCMYNHYRVAYTQGQDMGSWFDQDSELIPTSGIAQFRTVPYPPFDPAIVTSVPKACTNTTFRFPVSYNVLDYDRGGGQGLVDAIKGQILAGNAVLFALPVTAAYDNANATNGLIAFNTDQPNRGGHANVFIAYDDSIVFPNGDVGGLELQNQWNTWWALHGRAWISYATVAKFIFGVETVNVSGAGVHASHTVAGVSRLP